jgi:predicted ATP-binding protein involved in virulence
MYISNVHIKNIRCFEDINITFENNDGVPSSWTSILGDNASGKTCFLRCIAIGLCDELSGAALMKELYGSFIRDKDKPGIIQVTLFDPETRRNLIIKTVLESQRGYEKISQKVIKGKDLRNKVFICGYGIQRSIPGYNSFSEYSILEAVYTLFNYESPLQNPELIINRQNKLRQRQLLKSIGNILMLDEVRESEGKVALVSTDKGIVVRTPKGDVYLEDFGDGYRTSFTWLLDFIGWQIYYAGRLSAKGLLENIRGIILIDEVELHLHPKLQRNIVNKLRATFPNVQFITTTHSPVIVASVGQLLRPKGTKVIHFSFVPEQNRIRDYSFSEEQIVAFKGLQYDQLLASKPFGHLVKADEELERILIELSELAGKGKKRTPIENRRYKKIKEYLKKVMQPSGYTDFERDLQAELYAAMRKNIKKLEQKIFNDKN